MQSRGTGRHRCSQGGRKEVREQNSKGDREQTIQRERERTRERQIAWEHGSERVVEERKD